VRIVIKIRSSVVDSRRKALAMSLLALLGAFGAIAACTERGDVPIPGGGNNGATAPEAGCEDKPVPAIDISSLRNGQGALPFQGIVLDSDTGQPIPNAVITMEVGGVYLPYCDPGKANPFYELGGITGPDGTFTIPVPQSASSFGIHVFADNHLYGGNGKVGGQGVSLKMIQGNLDCKSTVDRVANDLTKVDASTLDADMVAATAPCNPDAGPDAQPPALSPLCTWANDTLAEGKACGGGDGGKPKHPGYLEIPVVTIGPELQSSRPIVTDVTAPKIVEAGAPFVLSAHAQAGAPKDPMSDEVLFVELPGTNPTSGPMPMACGELDPPSPGVPGGAFPDGVWTRTLTAPTNDGLTITPSGVGKPCSPAAPCTYTYYVVSSTQGCVTSQVSQAQWVTVQIQ
jgi:hypothetical protein